MEQFYAFGAFSAVLLGIGLWAIIDDGNGGGDDDDDVDPQRVNDLEFDGSQELTGTNGIDNVAAGQDDALAPDTIELKGRDDTATIDYAERMNVFGDDGNDDLEATVGADHRLWGGSGDDILTSVEGNSVSGQADNDTIDVNLQATHETGFETNVNGNEGDDLLNIHANIGIEGGAADSRATYEGGEGLDTFNVVLTVPDIAPEDGSAFGVHHNDLGKVTDFNPDEDTLTVDIRELTKLEGFDFTVDFDQREFNVTDENGDETGETSYVTNMAFKLTGDEGASELISNLRVVSTAAFTADDVEFFSNDPTSVSTTALNPLDETNVVYTEFGSAVSVVGTPHDDNFDSSVVEGPLAGHYLSYVFLGAGNDQADIAQTFHMRDVFGEDGDDTLTSYAAGSALKGDAGNDILTGGEGIKLSGGDGDDILTSYDGTYDLDLSHYYIGDTHVNGDDGNDTITFVTDTTADSSTYRFTVMDGGAGQDIFNIKINDNALAGDVDPTVTKMLGKIVDFSAAEDTINIEVTSDEGRDFEVAFRTVQDGGYTMLYRNEVNLKFYDDAGALVTTTQLRVISDDVITMDNLNFTGVQPTVPSAPVA